MSDPSGKSNKILMKQSVERLEMRNKSKAWQLLTDAVWVGYTLLREWELMDKIEKVRSLRIYGR